MRLVKLLAKELKEWPKDGSGDVVAVVQDPSKIAYVRHEEDADEFALSDGEWVGVWHNHETDRPLPELASYYKTAIVTREMWQAERKRIAKPGKKANAEGWVRHRGGKCPVEAGVSVDYRMRADVKAGVFSVADDGAALRWSHGMGPGDIMAYRIRKPAEETAGDKVMRECVEKCADTEPGESITINLRDPHPENPLIWRDRIREIERTVEALEEERVSLIQRIEGEGFKLIDQVNAKIAEAAQAHEDMSDWRNWRLGDIAEVVSTSGFTQSKLSVGDIVPIIDIDEQDGTVTAASSCWGDVGVNYKWHARPSA